MTEAGRIREEAHFARMVKVAVTHARVDRHLLREGAAKWTDGDGVIRVGDGYPEGYNWGLTEYDDYVNNCKATDMPVYYPRPVKQELTWGE